MTSTGHNSETLKAYEAAAELYRRRTPDLADPNMAELLDQAADRLPVHARILELGSGTGRDALLLEGRGYRVRRTDGAASFVAMMRADGHEADQLNVLTDEFGGPYDLVFANAMLLHFDSGELTVILRKAAAAVVPRGLLAFSVKEGDGARWSTAKLDRPRHFTFWREASLRALVEATGWRVLTVLSRSNDEYGGWLYVLAEAQDGE